MAPFVFLLVLILAGCTSYESAYEQAVYDDEPLYCYRSLAAVDCYRKPDRQSDNRLINYYGPAPGRTRPPRLQPAVALQPPPEGEGQEEVAEVPAADEQASSAAQPEPSDTSWKHWLPLISLGFGALQVVAAFVL